MECHTNIEQLQSRQSMKNWKAHFSGATEPVNLLNVLINTTDFSHPGSVTLIAKPFYNYEDKFICTLTRTCKDQSKPPSTAVVDADPTTTTTSTKVNAVIPSHTDVFSDGTDALTTKAKGEIPSNTGHTGVGPEGDDTKPISDYRRRNNKRPRLDSGIPTGAEEYPNQPFTAVSPDPIRKKHAGWNLMQLKQNGGNKCIVCQDTLEMGESEVSWSVRGGTSHDEVQCFMIHKLPTCPSEHVFLKCSRREDPEDQAEPSQEEVIEKVEVYCKEGNVFKAASKETELPLQQDTSTDENNIKTETNSGRMIFTPGQTCDGGVTTIILSLKLRINAMCRMKKINIT